MSKQIRHLCAHCEEAVKTETETKDTIYVSFTCKYEDKQGDKKMRCMVIRLPMTNHVVECGKFKRISWVERMKRRYLWWSDYV